MTRVSPDCANSFCTAVFWQGKYKTCRAAFLEMSRINSRVKKEAVKDRQRILALVQELMCITVYEPAIRVRIEKIREIVARQI